MTEPMDTSLRELATPYALNAVTDAERATIEARLAAAPAATADEFWREVRAVREAMVAVAWVTAAEPPLALRERTLAALGTPPGAATARPAPRSHLFTRRAVWAAAAAVIVVGLAWFGVNVALRPPAPSTAQQVIAATDVHTVSAPMPSGGTATALYSRQKDAAVLVMNDVRPPAPGSVYQVWLLGGQQPRSAGTMSAEALEHSRSVVVGDIASMHALAFTVEPGTGSPQPTGPILAQLPLA